MTLRPATLLRSATPVVLLTAWTLFVWVGRLRNIAAADDLTGWSLVGRLATAGLFTLAGLALTATLVWYATTRHPFSLPMVTWLAFPLAVVGSLFWLIRGTLIALGDYDAAFIAVHTMLAAVTIGLSLWVVRWLRGPPRRPDRTGPTTTQEPGPTTPQLRSR